MDNATDCKLALLPEFVCGRDGDLPLPCAVFFVDVDEEAQVAVDAHYVYASKEYCRSISRDADGIVGRSYLLEVEEGDKLEWLSRFYRVVALGETVSEFGYDALVRDWTCYTLAPSATPGHCVLSFQRMVMDEQRRLELMGTADARTSLFISRMLSKLAAEQSYNGAMNGMLTMMSEVIHADRLAVFECKGEKMETCFELLADGVESQLGYAFAVPKQMLASWFQNVTQDRVILVPNIAIVKRVSEPLYRWCIASGVGSIMAAPFSSDGEIVGFLGAYNYQIDETIDLNRLFEAVSTFIAARIENRQLIDGLRRASSHDTLTDLLNRRGSQQAMRERIEGDPNGEHVLVLMDLDDFKRVNDVYGHDAGDEALHSLARTLEQTFSSRAILARNGGDEFLALLSGDDATHAAELLADLMDRGLQFSFGGERHRLTISAGYVRYPNQADNLRELLSKADAALYAVKLSGKAGFKQFSSTTEDHARLRLGFSARDILESAPYPLLVSRANEQGEILFASTELAHLLGYSGMYHLMRATGGTLAGIVSPDDRERVRAEIERRERADEGTKPHVVSFYALNSEGGTTRVQTSFRFADIENSGRVLYSSYVLVD